MASSARRDIRLRQARKKISICLMFSGDGRNVSGAHLEKKRAGIVGSMTKADHRNRARPQNDRRKGWGRRGGSQPQRTQEAQASGSKKKRGRRKKKKNEHGPSLT